MDVYFITLILLCKLYVHNYIQVLRLLVLHCYVKLNNMFLWLSCMAYFMYFAMLFQEDQFKAQITSSNDTVSRIQAELRHQHDIRHQVINCN